MIAVGQVWFDATSVIADERGIDHLLALDSDCRTHGFSLVPADVDGSGS